MAITCAQCSYVNPDQSTFCVRCGNSLQANNQAFNAPNSYGQPTSFSNNPTYTPPFPSSSVPSTPSFAASSSGSAFGASPSAPSFAHPVSASTGNVTPVPLPAQMGTMQGQYTLRHAFAGHGAFLTHHSWLINGKQVQANVVSQTIRDIMRQRGIVGMNVNEERLTDSSVEAEVRDYLDVQRKGSTVFIYATPAGQDLYISRTSLVQMPINMVRVIILGLMLFIVFFGPAIVQSTTANMLASAATQPTSIGVIGGGITALLLPLILLSGLFALLYIPVLFTLIILLVRSLAVWALEKDFWMYLRSNYLNDFQLDDIMLLEHATDDSVRTAVAQLGLDATQIVPPTQGYQAKKRVRLF